MALLKPLIVCFKIVGCSVCMTIEDCLFGPRCVRIKNAGYNDAKFFCVVPFRLTACLRRVAVIHNTSLPQNAAGAQIDRLPFKWQRVPPASIERNPRNSRPNPYFTPIRPYETWPDGIMFLFVLKATTTFCNDQCQVARPKYMWIRFCNFHSAPRWTSEQKIQ